MTRLFCSFYNFLLAPPAVHLNWLFETTHAANHDFSSVVVMPFCVVLVALITSKRPPTALEPQPPEAVFVVLARPFIRQLAIQFELHLVGRFDPLDFGSLGLRPVLEAGKEPIIQYEVFLEALEALDDLLDATQRQLVAHNHILALAVNLPRDCADIFETCVDHCHVGEL